MHQFLKEKRRNLGFNLITVSQKTGIDTALLSKYESGQRIPSKKHLESLKDVYLISEEEIKKEFFIKKISDLLKNENYGFSILHETEKRFRESLDRRLGNTFIIPDSLKNEIKLLDEMNQKWKSVSKQNELKASNAVQLLIDELTFLWINDLKFEISKSELIDLKKYGKVNHTKSVEEWVKANQLVTAIDLIEKWSVKKELDEEIIRKIYFVLHRNEIELGFDLYRKKENPTDVHFASLPSTELLQFSIVSFLNLYLSEKGKLHTFLLATELVCRIIDLYPFEKNNELMVNLLVNFMLKANGFSMININVKELLKIRLKYEDENWRLMVLQTLIKEHKSSISFMLRKLE